MITTHEFPPECIISALFSDDDIVFTCVAVQYLYYLFNTVYCDGVLI